MAKATPSTTPPKPRIAVGLTRVSSGKQEFSAEDQAADIRKWAAQSQHQVLRIFCDDSISGSDLDRPGIKALLAFLESHPDKGTLVIWKRNRLVRREDPRQGIVLELKIEECGWKVEFLQGFQKSGNVLVDTIAGVFEHHQGGQYLLDLSVDTLRGLVGRFQSGSGTPGGAIPYGYSKLLEGPEDERRVIRRNQRHARGFGERASWVPGDPVEVKVIQRLFERYASGSYGMYSLCKDLNAEGVLGPKGRPWSRGTVRTILQNPIYKGDLVWNRTTQAKFFRFLGGKIVKVEGELLSPSNPEQEWVCVPGNHEPLVSAALWSAAKQRLEARARMNGGARHARTPYALSGLVTCGNCGAPMIGEACTANGYRYPKYVCASWGRNRGCHRFAIRQAKLEEAVLVKLKESLLPSQDLGALESELLAAYERRAADEAPLWERDALMSEVKQLERRVGQASENLGLLRGSAAKSLAEKLNGWCERLEELEAVLETPEDDSASGGEEVVRKAMSLLTEIDTLQPESSPVRLRALFEATVARIELRFGRRQTPKSFRNFLERGVVTLQSSCAELRGQLSGSERGLERLDLLAH